jgi:class 3 adenylate cyclase
MHCDKCGAENPDPKRFCGDCGAALSTAAGAQSSVDPLAVSAAILPVEAAELPEGERKTVTALFADIKGSTELMESLDPEEARAIIDPALKLMIDAVHRYDGYVVQSTGDGIFALFGAPVAHEDHPQRALHAALAARDELRRRGEDLRRLGRSGIEVRIGINTGEVVMRKVQTGGHTEYAPVGHVINLASRMQSVAPADASCSLKRRGVWSKAISNCAASARRQSKGSARRSTFMRSWVSARCAAISNSQHGAG